MFLDQCLHNLQLSQFGGTFTKPVSCGKLERFGENTIKLMQMKIEKHCFKNKCTLTVIQIHTKFFFSSNEMQNLTPEKIEIL